MLNELKENWLKAVNRFCPFEQEGSYLMSHGEKANIKDETF
jgi:hypothetical protein